MRPFSVIGTMSLVFAADSINFSDLVTRGDSSLYLRFSCGFIAGNCKDSC